ncbi:MAG: protease inhibitor I42 family protein [Candidatus Sericytochromatia bacterium]|nr:protease inhibitor I42 family protein [Candidatus Sericytochromatia bacterium]
MKAAATEPAVTAEPLSLLGRAKQMLDFFISDQSLQIPDRVVDLKQLQSGALKVQPGETFAVRVRENASTGYRWQASSDNLTALGEVAQTPKGRRDGSSADRFFVFQAPQEGHAKLSLSHGRPAEPETQKLYPAVIQLER